MDNDPRNPGPPLVETCDDCGGIVGAESLREAPGYSDQDFCKCGTDTKGGPMKIDRTAPGKNEMGYDYIRPNSSKWGSRYASEKNSGLVSDALMHPQIADVATGIGHGVTNVLHGIGQGVSWLGDAMTHPFQSHLPAGAAEKIEKAKELAKLYPAGSYPQTHLQQQAIDLASNPVLDSMPKAIVGPIADAAALGTVPKLLQLAPKALENFGLKKPKPPHLDFGDMNK